MTHWDRVAVICVALLLIALGASLAEPEYGQRCVQEYNPTEQCPSYDLIRYYLIGLGFWFEAHNAVVVAAATIVIAIFTLVLVRTERRHAEHTEIVQRAYLSVEPGGLHRYHDGTNRFSAELVIRNAGSLPAKHVTWFIDRKIRRGDWFDFPIGDLSGNLVIASGTRVRKGSPFLAGKELTLSKRNAKLGECWLYVWGRVEYHDGFRPDRWIEFCHRYNLASRNRPSREIDENAGRFYGLAGNHTDEDRPER